MPLRKLNPEQKQAATSALGYNLIIASAGTGKTSTIVGRIGYLLTKGVKPEEILLLTFTNKASKEMIDRVGQYFDEHVVKKIEAGTFHAVSYRKLKEHNKHILLKQPSELKALFRTIYDRYRFDHIDSTTVPFSSNYLFDTYSFYQNQSNAVIDFSTWLEANKSEHEAFFDIYVDIVDNYNEVRNSYNFVGFNDLLFEMRKLIDEVRLPYKEVLVDEFQDTNDLQASLIDAMKPESLFCVGDYDQSIYAFNGANIENIANFTSKYSNANIFTLTKNYRSTKPILMLAQKVIEKNERIYPKRLEVVRTDAHIVPRVLMFDELMVQYKSIAKLIAQSRTPNDEIAIIFRNNSSADGLEASLRELGIICKRRGSGSFFETKEIKVALNLLTLLINPKDVMAFIDIVSYAPKVGASIAKDIFDALLLVGEGSVVRGLLHPQDVKNPFAKRNKSYQLGLFDDHLEIGSISRFRDLHLEEAFLANPILKHPKLSVEGANFLYELFKLFRELKRVSVPYNVLERVIKSNFFKLIVENLSSKRATLKNGQIDAKLQAEKKLAIYQKTALLSNLCKPYMELGRFLNAMILGASEMSEGQGVNLLTIHASKGLEFKEVYVVDLMQDRFPNKSLMSKGGSLDEERRLFYVALTRAKDILYLSFARYDNYKKMRFEPSIFLYEGEVIKQKDAL